MCGRYGNNNTSKGLNFNLPMRSCYRGKNIAQSESSSIEQRRGALAASPRWVLQTESERWREKERGNDRGVCLLAVVTVIPVGWWSAHAEIHPSLRRIPAARGAATICQCHRALRPHASEHFNTAQPLCFSLSALNEYKRHKHSSAPARLITWTLS